MVFCYGYQNEPAVLGYQWLELLAEALPVRYSIEQSEEFYILSADDSSTNNRMLQWCEAIRKKILTTLKDVACDEGYGKHIVLVFHNWETYYDYVTDFYPDSGEFAPSGGMFINHGYSHFAICTQGNYQVERTIAHELTHTMLRHLPLPLWVDEGITQILEGIILDRSYFNINSALAQQHRCYWNAESIQQFWMGDSFSFSGEGCHLSYSLAEVLMRNLMTDFPSKISDFLNAANDKDAGNQALLNTCGISLKESVTQFLGEGNWTPRKNPDWRAPGWEGVVPK